MFFSILFFVGHKYESISLFGSAQIISCMAEEDLQKLDGGEAPEDLQLKHEDVDVPEKLQPTQIQESAHDEGNRWPGWPGENVFRVLIPLHKVGSFIGRKGESIKKIIEETKARIKVLDGPPGFLERAVSLIFLFNYIIYKG